MASFWDSIEYFKEADLTDLEILDISSGTVENQLDGSLYIKAILNNSYKEICSCNPARKHKHYCWDTHSPQKKSGWYKLRKKLQSTIST